MPLRDLAVELLGCMRLAKNLSSLNMTDYNQQVREDKKSTQSASDDTDNSEQKGYTISGVSRSEFHGMKLKRFSNWIMNMKPTVYVKNEFEDNGDGTITDHATGLIWKKFGIR